MGAMFRGVLSVSMLFLFFAQPAVAQWTQCAGPEGGYVNGFVDGGAVLYAATSRQVYAYDKGTQRWQPLGTYYPGEWLQAITETNGSLLVGNTNGSIFRSPDGGATWTQTGTGWSSILQFATTSTTVFAAAGTKLVIKSTDGGLTWSETESKPEGRSVEAITAVGDRILAASNAGLFRSEDAGKNWTKVAEYGGIRCFFVDGGSVYAAENRTVYRSTDDGATWATAGIAWDLDRILCMARSSSYLYAGALDGGIARSSDDGATWEQVNTNLPDLRIYSMVTDGATVYAGTGGGGMHALTEPGNSWSPHNDGLYALSVRAIHPMGTKVYTATTGRGIMVADAGNLDSWSAQNGGFPAANVFCLAHAGSILLAGSDDFGLYRSGDGGNSWAQPASGLQDGDMFSLSVIGQDVYAMTNGRGIHHSSDAGDSWTQRGDSISGEAVYALAESGSKLYAAMFRKGVLMSSDAGVNWIPVSDGLPGSRIIAIHAHGNALFAGVHLNGTYRSTNEGASWTRMVGAIDGSVAQSFLSIGTFLVAGTATGGVFGSSDTGETWIALNDGLVEETVYSLAMQGDMLLAGVQCGGVWTRPLSEVLLDVEGGVSLPQAFRLHPVAPQPLRDRGTVRFDLDTGADVRLELFDLLGRHVSTAAASRYDAGSHSTAIDVSGLRTGCYLLRLQAGGAQATQRVTVIR